MSLSLNFKDYAKKLETLGENVPKVFKQVAGWGAKHAEKTAVELTDYEKLVDTGAYKRNWHAEVIKDGENYGITLQNNMEYASYLEDGYDIKKAHFVPFEAGSGTTKAGKHWQTKGMEGTPKTKEFIASFRARYPNAKGFLAKPRRFKGKKIGKRTLTDLEGWALIELRNEIDVAMTAKKYNISKGDARKLIK